MWAVDASLGFRVGVVVTDAEETHDGEREQTLHDETERANRTLDEELVRPRGGGGGGGVRVSDEPGGSRSTLAHVFGEYGAEESRIVVVQSAHRSCCRCCGRRWRWQRWRAPALVEEHVGRVGLVVLVVVVDEAGGQVGAVGVVAAEALACLVVDRVEASHLRVVEHVPLPPVRSSSKHKTKQRQTHLIFSYFLVDYFVEGRFLFKVNFDS